MVVKAGEVVKGATADREARTPPIAMVAGRVGTAAMDDGARLGLTVPKVKRDMQTFQSAAA